VKTAVIGGGVFGATTAIRLAEAGRAVTIYERLPDLLLATSRNGNRLHMGYHYPRDEPTVRQCQRGYERFKHEFGEAILGEVTNQYFIASKDSLVSADDFLAFCDRMGLPYRIVEPADYADRIANVAVGIATPEVVFDSTILRRLMLGRLAGLGVSVRVGREVARVEPATPSGFAITVADGEGETFDAIVNCAYANASRIAAMLGHASPTRQYEYLAVPIVELDQERRQDSFTLLDGPFFSLLPFGNSGHLLNHVDHSVVARDYAPVLDAAWLDPETAPLAAFDRQSTFGKIIAACVEYMPELRRARLKGFVEAPRMVLAGVDDTDARPSIVELRAPGYVEVFSGKVDHCVWVGDQVATLLASG
jgi:glycine/D-amino acid oxidase-like deaminating enzyme